MAEIDLFQNLRLDEELQKATKVPEFKWSLANRSGYKAAKQQFYKDFDEVGMKITNILNNAPMVNDAQGNPIRYAESDQLDMVKRYIRDFNQAFYSINDEFSKHIEKDMGFKLKQANMHDLFSTTMIDIVDHGGYDPRELEAAMTGNAKVSSAINDQTKAENSMLENELKGYRDIMMNQIEEGYGSDTEDYKLAKIKFDRIAPEYEKRTGIKMSSLWEDIDESAFQAKGDPVVKEKSTFDIVQEASGIDAGDIAKYTAIVGGGAAIYNADKIPKAAKIAKDAVVNGTKYLHNVTKLNATDIAKFLDDDGVKRAMQEVTKYNDQITEIEGKINQRTASKDDMSKLKQLRRQLDKTITRVTSNASNMFKGKVDSKTIKQLFDKNVAGKWNIYRFKGGFPKIPGTKPGKLFQNYAIGGWVNEALGVDELGIVQPVADIATGKLAQSAWSKLSTLSKSPQGRKWIYNKLGSAAGKQILGKGALAKLVPGLGWASFVYGLGSAGVDLIGALNEAPEELLKKDIKNK